MSSNKKKITELIEQDLIQSSLDHYFGLGDYNYSENNFRNTCTKFGFQRTSLIHDLEKVNQKGEEHDLFLISYPLDVIIEYLKYNHFLFIKKSLPQIMQLLNDIAHKLEDSVIRDLQFAMSIFIEDFIRQVYDEESNFFMDVLYLQSTYNQTWNPGKLFYQLEKNTIHKFAAQHELVSNEMISIRNITNDYSLDVKTHDSIRLLFIELKKFEKELQLHTKIENELLFPKALTLEKRVRKMFRKTIALN